MARLDDYSRKSSIGARNFRSTNYSVNRPGGSTIKVNFLSKASSNEHQKGVVLQARSSNIASTLKASSLKGSSEPEDHEEQKRKNRMNIN